MGISTIRERFSIIHQVKCAQCIQVTFHAFWLHKSQCSNALVDTPRDDGDLGDLVGQHGDNLRPHLLLQLLCIGPGSQSGGFTVASLAKAQ